MDRFATPKLDADTNTYSVPCGDHRYKQIRLVEIRWYHKVFDALSGFLKRKGKSRGMFHPTHTILINVLVGKDALGETQIRLG